MKKIFLICLLTFLCMSLTALETSALTFDKLPTKQTSKQWSIQVGEAEQGKGLAKPEKGKFHTYSLEVDNIGEDVFSMEVNMFRNEPNSRTKFSLFSCPDGEDCNKDHYERAKSTAKQLNNGMPYRFTNFLLSEKATELEVEIIWTQDRNGQTFKRNIYIYC